MEPGRAQDFTVTFSPDHESLYFSDRLQVVLFEKVRLQDPSPDPYSRPNPPASACLRPSPSPKRPHIGVLLPGGSASGWGSCGGETRVLSPTGLHPNTAYSRNPIRGSRTESAVLLPPENLPPDPPEGLGPQAHDVCGRRRPPGCACGVPDRDPCLGPRAHRG